MRIEGPFSGGCHGSPLQWNINDTNEVLMIPMGHYNDINEVSMQLNRIDMV